MPESNGSRSIDRPNPQGQSTWRVHRSGTAGLSTAGLELLDALGLTSSQCFVFQVRGGVPRQQTWRRPRSDRLARPSVAESAAWRAFLATVEHQFGLQISTASERIWTTLVSDLGTPPIPVAVVGPEGGLELVWDTGLRRLDVELLREGGLHWFYRDRSTAEHGGTEDEPVADLPRDFLIRLRDLL